MYDQFFQLKQAPFSIAPDPRYLFMSERHREALAHLLYGVNSGGGFVLLTGEIGAGKTTICRCFLEQVPPNCNVAYIFNPKLTANELLHTICNEFRITLPNGEKDPLTAKVYVDFLTAYLLMQHAEGRNNVLIIDEAQNLSVEVLEQLRLLTNLETNERKLLQIILIGQPELREILARQELEQLAQRIIARYHLDSLAPMETGGYILHRMAVAGALNITPFKPHVMRRIHQLTQGVPRRINLLCDRALLGAYAENKHEVTSHILNKAALEVFGQPTTIRSQRFAMAGVAIGAVGSAAIAAAVWMAIGHKPTKSLTMMQQATTAASSLPSATASPPAAIQQNLKLDKEIHPALVSVTNEEPVTGPTAAWDSPPDSQILLHERIAALQGLGKLWGVKLNETLPCFAAQSENLHCYLSSNTDLAEIRQLNRPVVLTLRDDANKTYYALLTGMNHAQATIQVRGVSRTVSLQTLARHFNGEIITLWQAPSRYRELIGLGYNGEEADWITQQIAKAAGMKAKAHQSFDQTLLQQVRRFQSAQGVKVDGVVGPQTYMQLNRVAGISEPQLRHRTTEVIASAKE
jgi:general secretion pathway protein A